MVAAEEGGPEQQDISERQDEAGRRSGSGVQGSAEMQGAEIQGGEGVRGVVAGQAAARNPARSETDSASDLRLRLAAALRGQGDDSLADALDHGRLEVKGGQVEIRSLPDYRAVLEIGLATVQEAVRSVLAGNSRVTLGGDLGAAESGSQAVSSSEASRPGPAGGESPGRSEVAQRALADPEVQRIQKLFAGQIREVRNLRGYTT